MEVIETKIKGLLIIKPKVFSDSRGYFFESYNADVFKKNKIIADFVQDNQSLSNSRVLRGLHFQAPPFDQGKLVRVINGAVLDVAVDIRKSSPTYGQHVSVKLTEENKTMFYIPPGFAHGFVTLRDNTIFSYKCTNVYHKDSEGCVLWNDKDLNINWNVENPTLSEKDITGTPFKNFTSPF